jgi:hypothetical protein
MKKLSYLAFAATIAVGGLAFSAPAFAATAPVTGNTGVLSCNTGNSAAAHRDAKQQLEAQLQLDTKDTPTIDDWNGCFKVQYTDNSGHTVVGLYDPDTLNLVNKLS